MTAELPPPEFSRMIALRHVTGTPLTLEASEAERRALAARFGLVSVDRLAATVSLTATGGVVSVTGQFDAAWVQPCAVSGEDLPQAVSEELSLRFVPAADHPSGEEIELSDEACDEIEYDGVAFDLGEALAQSLGLAIDPFAEGPGAEAARQAAGIVEEGEAGPFAGLAGLKLKKD